MSPPRAQPGPANVVSLGRRDPPGALSFVVELWSAGRDGPERVIGRAGSMTVAQAIFTAARTEHPGRRIVLRRDQTVVAEAG